MTKSNGSFRLRALIALAGTAVLPAIALAQPANDNCSSPATATVGANAGTNVDATNDGNPEPPCGIDDTYTEDVWFTFTTGAAGEYVFDTEGSVVLDDTVVEIYASCGGALLGCDDDGGTGLLSRATAILGASQTVRIRVAGYDGTEGDFILNITAAPPPTNNDSCVLPTALSLSSSTPGTTVGYAFNGPQSTCAFFGFPDGPDAFFVFTPTVTSSYSITLTPTDFAFDSVLTAASSCAFTPAACSDNTGTAGIETVTVIGTAGVPVYVRAAGWGGEEGDFEITVADVGPPAGNDVCGSATALTLDTPVTGDNATATSQGIEGSCTVAVNDVWYSFQAPADGTYLFTVDGPAGNSITLFGSCGGPEISCAINEGIVRNALSMTTGQTVYLRVAGFGDAINTFTIVAGEAVPPANDDCETATVVALPAGGNFTSDGLAAGDDQDVSCNDDDAAGMTRGVWYTMTTGIDAGTLTIESTSLNDDMAFAVFTGSCGALTEVACSDPELFDVELAPNTTYFVLVGLWFDGAAPIDLYNINFSFEAATGGCCTGTSCAITSASACATSSGTFLGVGAGCSAPAGNPVDFTGGSNLPQVIADNATGTSDISVSSTTPIGGVSVTFTATHTYAADLDITISNGSVTAAVIQDQGAQFELNGTYTFSDAATQTFADAAALLVDTTDDIPPGAYRAVDTNGDLVSLNDAFYNATPNTTWTLSIGDDAGGDTGELTSWTLSLDGQGPSPCSSGPTPCELADFNDSGSVTADDIFAFLDAWFAQNGSTGPGFSADINDSDSVTADDIFAFLDLWFAQNGQSCN